MVALCRALGIDPATLVHPFYLISTEKDILGAALPARPVDTSQLGRDSCMMSPPKEVKQRGAPKKKRISSWHDEHEQTKKKRVVTCGRCGAQGHYRRGCKAPLDSTQ